MYYYPRIANLFSPGSFTHKDFDNTPMVRLFKPSLTPEPSQSPSRRRTYSIAVKRQESRSRSFSRPYAQVGIQKIISSNNQNSSKPEAVLNKASILYVSTRTKQLGDEGHLTLTFHLDEYMARIYFRKLKGRPSREFYQKLEPYIRLIVLMGEYDSQIDEQWIPTQFQGILTQQGLISAISKLEKAGRKELIRELIVYYCVPNEAVRKQVLESLIGDIHLKLQQKISLDFAFGQYCLVTPKGKIINNYLKTPFFTNDLVFCARNNIDQSICRYRELKTTSPNRNSLLRTIKEGLRERVKMCEEDPPEKVKLFQKRVEVETISLVSKRRKLAPEFKRPKAKNDQKSMTIARLKFDHQLSLKDATTFVSEFYKLHALNARFNEAFNLQEGHAHLVLFDSFRTNCVSLQGKSQQTIDKILKAMEILPDSKTIELAVYVQFRMVVECLAESTRILRFLVQFLELDKHKQLTRQQLGQVFKSTLSEYKIPKSNRVIIDILWLQFKRNNLVSYVNGQELLTINIFKENYVLNKTVYFFLVTLIFCTSDPVSAAYDALT